MAELITVEGTAGARFTVDPAVPWVATQLANRMLVQVERPEPKAAPETETGAERPAQSAAKEVWVAYIARTTDLSEAEAADLTKADLIALAAEEE
ncbi:hypothetical protein [Nocardiopsis synnemataformans]|uniref:hypothetical protein n=1 Tax=Nocardiopsis synnemataformans TaxID=61305 RepID=UPI003EBC929A